MIDYITHALLVAILILVLDSRRTLKRILKTEVRQMALIDDVEQEVRENSDAVDSAVLLLQKLSQMIKDAGTDPVKLAAIRDNLDSKTKQLAEAVVANTPAEPTP